MSLRRQITLLLAVMSVVIVSTTYAVQQLVVMPAFEELERQGADRDIRRCAEALQAEIDSIANTAHDWGAWDETYQYVEDRNQAFVESNLTNESFGNAHLNLICLVNDRREIVWGDVRDMETLEEIPSPDLLAAIVQPTNPLGAHDEVDSCARGVISTAHGPMLIASRPLVTTRREGPIRGAMVMGKFLHAPLITDLAEQTHLALNVVDLSQAQLSEDETLALKHATPEKPWIVPTPESNCLHAYSTLPDIFGKPLLQLRVTVPRDVTAQGRVSANIATACSLAAGLLTLLVLAIVLERRIVGPLQRMAQHAEQIGKNDDLKARLKFDRQDELGTLAREFDKMVVSLAETRNNVLETAHKAGKAEIASEVLHNVGNAVNSANCSVELLDERLSNSKLSGLAKATGLLKDQLPRAAEFFSQDPRGPKLVEYLTGLNDVLQQERGMNREEVTRLRDTIRHIRECISAQQSYAGKANFCQEVQLSHLLDETLQINRHQIDIAGVEVRLDLPDLPELTLNKSKVTQVLVNLVRNAIHAMQAQASGPRILTIAARPIEEDGLELSINDTGYGFDDDIRLKLFTQRFTTKPDGNGLGLHYCANSVKEMGGSITAISAGPGQGASFRIRLPRVMPSLEPATT